MFSIKDFQQRIEKDGWIIFPCVVPESLIDDLLDDLAKAWNICREIQKKNGVSSDADLTLHHLAALGNSFVELLNLMAVLDPYFEDYFGGKYVLNSIGGAINTTGRSSYAHRIHRDIRTYSGNIPLLLNTLVMLDDFTADNGATFMGTGTHKSAEKIKDSAFYATASRALGPAGSILVFNSNVWHAGGDNKTAKPRRSVTPMFCRPFIKPQFDYPRALGYDRVDWSPYLRQILGYNSRVPSSLDEWYQPPARRMYQQDQG